MLLFCERIKEERKRLKLTQEQVAQLTEITVQSQRSYESGKRIPDLVYLSVLGKFGFDTGYILSGQHSSHSLTPDEEMLLAGYRALDARSKAGVFALLGGLNQQTGAAPHINAPVYGQQFNAPIGQIAGGNIITNKPSK